MAETKSEPGFVLVDDSEAAEGESRAPRGNFEAMPFGAFVLSLSASALLNLGIRPENELEIPGVEPPEINLDLARQTIGILEMLREKTHGNLDGDEARLLEQLLHDLHMRFVEVKRSLG